MKNKSFKFWSRQDLTNHFGLNINSDCSDLNAWLNAEANISSFEREALTQLQQKLGDNVDIWNEQELIIKFIAPLVNMVDYDTTHYKVFANRRLSGTIKGAESGRGSRFNDC